MENILWDRLLVDIIGLYKIKREGWDYPLILKYLIKIYPTTRWFGIVQYNDKQADTLEYIVYK